MSAVVPSVTPKPGPAEAACRWRTQPVKRRQARLPLPRGSGADRDRTAARRR